MAYSFKKIVVLLEIYTTLQTTSTNRRCGYFSISGQQKKVARQFVMKNVFSHAFDFCHLIWGILTLDISWKFDFICELIRILLTFSTKKLIFSLESDCYL